MFRGARELKKEIIKNVFKVFIILLVAVISTYFIYHKFQNNRDVDFKSDSLDIVFHDTRGDRISITKATPVTDSVGLSSNSYSLSIQNNLTIGVPYQIRIVRDDDKILEDDCLEKLISEEDIRVSIKVGKENNIIYSLNELENGILLEKEIDALMEDDISIRMWVSIDSGVPSGSSMHYHGIIQVIEDGNILAINQ